jgi:hypothetical protein
MGHGNSITPKSCALALAHITKLNQRVRLPVQCWNQGWAGATDPMTPIACQFSDLCVRSEHLQCPVHARIHHTRPITPWLSSQGPSCASTAQQPEKKLQYRSRSQRAIPVLASAAMDESHSDV